MSERWIKSYEKLLDWEWTDDPYIFTFWVKLLLLVNVKTKRWHGKAIKRGQLLTSMRNLEERLGWSHHTIQRILDALQSTGEIIVESSNEGTLITVVNFSKYQGEGVANDATQPATQPATLGATHSATLSATPGVANDATNIRNIDSIEGKNVKKEKNNNSAPSVRTRYEKIFEDVFLNRTGHTFSWNKREAIAVNAIIGKIEKIMLGQNRVPTPDVKADGFRWFLDKLYDTGDGWITSNFVPHVINDKFNEYYLTIKNGRNGKQNNDNPSNVSEEWLRAILTRNVQS